MFNFQTLIRINFYFFRFYGEYREQYSLSSNFETRIRNEANAWLKEYLAKEFNPFLKSMGGWEDIHDYMRSVKFNSVAADNLGALATTVGVAVAVAGFGALIKKSMS